MKTLQINTRETGGAGIACLRLHDALLQKGTESSVLVLEKGEESKKGVIPYFPAAYGGGLRSKMMQQAYVLDRKLKWRQLNRLEKGYEAFSFADNPLNINAHPAVKNADVLNLHWVSWWMDYESFFKTEKPVVWTLHDMTPFSDGNPYELGFPFKSYEKLLQRNRRIKQQALRGKDIHIVTLNKWMYEKSSNSRLFGDFEHSIIPNSIDTEIFKRYPEAGVRKSLNIPADAPFLLFVAGDLKNKRKGLDLLFDALKVYQKEKVYVVAVGGKMNDIPDLGKHVFIPTGSIYDKIKLAQIYSAADLYVIPSREDNLPNTVMESITCGTPTVGFDIGGISDMIENEFNGLLSEEVSAAALADTIETGFKTYFNRDNIRADAEERFSPTIQAEAYLELYKSLL